MKFIGNPQSGSQDGLTSSRNRFGQYLRTRAVPVNPNSTAQGQRRVAFAAAASAWRTLSNLQRLAWNNYALSLPVVDSLGQTQTLSGFQQFSGVNSLNAILDVSPTLIETPPPLPEFLGIEPTAAVVTGGTSITTLLNLIASLTASNIIEIFATPAVSIGRSTGSIKSMLRLIALAGNDAPTGAALPGIAIPVTLIPMVLTTAWLTKFGGVIGDLEWTNTTIFVGVREISNYQRGPLKIVKATVV